MLPFLQEEYLRIISSHISDFNENNLKIYNGWNYAVFVVSDQVAFRFSRNGKWNKRLPSEAKFSQLLAKTTEVSIPLQKLYEDPKMGFYSVYKYIPGIQLNEDLVAGLSKEQRIEIAQKVGRFLTSIHSLDKEIVKKVGVEIVDPKVFWEDRLKGNRESTYTFLDEEEKNWIEVVFRDFFKLIEETGALQVPTHFDMRLEHLIVDSELSVLNGIIDISGYLADPAYDFIFFEKDFLDLVYQFYKFPKDEKFNERLDFYKKAQVVYDIENYSALNDLEKLDLAKQKLVSAMRG